MALAKIALAFLVADDKYLTAKVKAGAEPENDDLHSAAHMLGEHRETARRALGDAIVRADPQLTDEVRKVVWFSLTDATHGTINKANS